MQQDLHVAEGCRRHGPNAAGTSRPERQPGIDAGSSARDTHPCASSGHHASPGRKCPVRLFPASPATSCRFQRSERPDRPWTFGQALSTHSSQPVSTGDARCAVSGRVSVRVHRLAVRGGRIPPPDIRSLSLPGGGLHLSLERPRRVPRRRHGAYLLPVARPAPPWQHLDIGGPSRHLGAHRGMAHGHRSGNWPARIHGEHGARLHRCRPLQIHEPHVAERLSDARRAQDADRTGAPLLDDHATGPCCAWSPTPP